MNYGGFFFSFGPTPSQFSATSHGPLKLASWTLGSVRTEESELNQISSYIKQFMIILNIFSIPHYQSLEQKWLSHLEVGM